MSRTKKSGKGPGYEYWSKRPGSRNHGTAPGRESKKMTHRLERIEGKDEITQQMIEEAIKSAENMGAAEDIFHPDYGWIQLKGELTEAGVKFYEDHREFYEKKEKAEADGRDHVEAGKVPPSDDES